ncbi:MAG: HK97 family phage prohead protease [Lachnospiraceae bacterium]|nr:HK97 family phage prohead protease [Lachnospiraceae bacterium]
MEQITMKPITLEIRSGGVHIEGYVNAVLRESRPVITPRGKVNEIVEQRTFQKAIDNANNIDILVDHDKSQKVGSTSQGNLSLKEDEIGLRAVTDITDPYVVEKARTNQIRGWSFGFTTIKDSLEMRAEKLPLRHLKDISLKEVSLIINQMSCYSATSVEVRAGNEEMIELRNTVEDLIPQEQMQEPQEDVEDEKKNKEVEAKEPNEDDTKVTVKDPEQPPQEIPLEDKPKDAYYNEYLIRVIKLKRRK